MDRFVELGSIDRFVLAHWMTRLDPWLERGFVKAQGQHVALALFSALHYVRSQQVETIWSRLFGSPAPRGADLWELSQELSERTCELSPSIVVLERRIERGIFAPPAPRREGPPQPQRTDTDHYVVVQALDPDGQPVPGVRLELLIAGGEVRSAQTGSDGYARVERIQAGRVVVRVLGVDGSAWHPESGEGSQASGSDSGRWHPVQRGDSLSRIARRYGLKSWKALWEAPQNEPIRKKRKNPNVIHPGDDVYVPGMTVFEIVRETDLTHRIIISKRRPAVAVINVHLLADRASVAAAWSQGQTTLGAAAVTYSDPTGVVLQMAFVPEQTRLALVPPAEGATEATASATGTYA